MDNIPVSSPYLDDGSNDYKYPSDHALSDEEIKKIALEKNRVLVHVEMSATVGNVNPMFIPPAKYIYYFR